MLKTNGKFKKETRLSVLHAFVLLQRQPPIFPDPERVRWILDHTQAKLEDYTKWRRMINEIRWWAGWLEADDEIRDGGGRPPSIPTCLRDFPDDVIESIPMGGYRLSGWRNRVQMDPKIKEWRRRQREACEASPH